mgnify:CR=1 FL=1
MNERLEIRMSPEEKKAARTLAAADGYRGRHFSLWARAKLTGQDPEPPVGGEDSPYLTVSEAAEVLQCSRQTVYACIRRGHIIDVVDSPRTAIPRENFIALRDAPNEVRRAAKEGLVTVWAMEDEKDVCSGVVLLGDFRRAQAG